RTFPTSVGPLALLEDLHGDYREGTSSPLLRAGTTLASAHPQVSSIAPKVCMTSGSANGTAV
ncbi:MAG TPA: hypothetical protein VIU11_06650, partial [Nakamurella sp.]